MHFSSSLIEQRIFEPFDAFVAENDIDLQRGVQLGVGSLATVHASQGYAIRNIHYWSLVHGKSQIAEEYAHNFVHGLEVPHLEQIQVASRQGYTISDIVPGKSGAQAGPEDLDGLEDNGPDQLLLTLEAMQERGIGIDPPYLDEDNDDPRPSGNIMIGGHFGFVDYVYGIDQTLPRKIGLMARTCLFLGINSDTPASVVAGRTEAHTLPVIRKMLAACTSQYGKHSPMAAAIVRELRIWEELTNSTN